MGDVFEAQGLPREHAAVRVSDRPDLAQFQCNGAMACAGKRRGGAEPRQGQDEVAKKNPREIAQGIVEALAPYCHSDRPKGVEGSEVGSDPSTDARDDRGALQDDRGAHHDDTGGQSVFSRIEIAGPGFINLDLTAGYIAAHLDQVEGSETLGAETTGEGRTIILDYGGMNVAKAMHVGHLRSLAIGSCLKNVMNFAGYKALGDIHMGDWGLQMGQIISEFEIRHPDWPYFDESFEGPYPEEPPFSYSDLERIYPEASQACKNDTSRLEKAQKATAELQNHRPGYLALWRHFMTLSIADIKKNIGPFGIDFEIWKGEASVNDLIPEITEDLKAKNVVEESDGALIIPVAEEDDKQEIPPLIYLNSRGAQTYGTTDIGTIYDRVREYPDLTAMIYETDQRQALHFEQLFRACRKAGYLDGVEVTHIGHGTINGPDGKPFKTRDGGTMKFAEMVSAALDKAEQRLHEANLADDVSADEHKDIARKVAIAALKYTELSNQAHINYIFDLERMTQFEGKTGPYLLYQAVRIKSLLRKAGEIDHDAPFVIREEDQKLALLLAEWPDHCRQVVENLTPHVLCEYVYKLAQGFSSFYAACHILSEEDAALRASRLKLCDLTCRQIEMILNLLGIDVPERM